MSENNLQNGGWERSLPELVENLKIRKELARLRIIVPNEEKLIKQKEKILKKLREVPQILETQGIECGNISEPLKKKIYVISEEIEVAKSNLRGKQIRLRDINAEDARITMRYYEISRSGIFNDVKIRKGQVNVEEFEALLFYMKTINIMPYELFEPDDFWHMFPALSCKLKMTYGTNGTKNFYQARFEEVFYIWL